MYASGLVGIPQDDAEAQRWFRLAAEQGDADAQFILGVMGEVYKARDTRPERTVETSDDDAS